MKRHAAQWNKISAHITNGYMACMLSFFLLYCVINGYSGIPDSKWQLYLLLSGGYLVILFVMRLELSLVGAAIWPKPVAFWHNLNTSQKMICVFWLCSAVSTLTAVDRKIAFRGSTRHEGLITITLYCGCCLAVSLYGKLKAWMLWIFAAGMSLNCILALIQLAGYNPFGLYPQGLNYYDKYTLYAGEFLGTIGNVDLLSAVLCIAIPLFWISIIKGTDLKRYWLILPLGLCITVLLRVFVAGGIVAMAGSVLFTIPVLQRTRKARQITGIAAVSICVLGVTMIYFYGAQLGGFLYEASELLHGRWDDSFGSGRLYIWRKMMELVPQHPLFGSGPDTIGLCTDAAFERMNATVGAVIRSQIDNAHNEYLNILVERGAISLIVYLALLIRCAVHWVRNAAEQPITAICGGAVLAYCIQAFFGLSSPVSAPYFWLVLGGLIGTIPSNTKENTMKGEQKRW